MFSKFMTSRACCYQPTKTVMELQDAHRNRAFWRRVFLFVVRLSRCEPFAGGWRSSTALLGGTSRELSTAWRAFFSRHDFGKARTGGTTMACSVFSAADCVAVARSNSAACFFVAFAIAAVHWARSFIWVTAMSTDLASGERRNQRDDHPIGSEAASCLTKGAFLYPQERTCAVH